MITAGEEWDDKIKRELDEADVVIVLLSSPALSTDYITNIEIPAALQLHEKGELVVVPVILEDCRWTNTPLGRLNALPEKGKPLNKWNPISDAWKSVSDGLAKVFSKLIKEGPKSERTEGRRPRH